MEAKRTAQPKSDQSYAVSDIQGDSPGSASNGPSEAHSRSGRAEPTIASPGKRLRKRLWAGASPELGKKRARGATADPASGKSQAYEDMSLKALRKHADTSPGMQKKQKVGEIVAKQKKPRKQKEKETKRPKEQAA